MKPIVNGKRLWSRLMDMAQVGATSKGGCNRQALTDADKAGRELFMSWCEAAGCTVRVDEIGNIFARRPGKNNDLAPVITGSHLDTQPTGGKFDGVYGVLAGLEVIETLNDHGTETDVPLEVVVWTNEEGARFPAAMMGSAVWAGSMSLEHALALADRDGKTVAEELERIGHRGSAPATHAPVKAAFEVHIEQGPVLEAENRTIGIVTGVQHMSRHEIIITGQEAHAGPTPMSMRKDPVMALAGILPRLYELADDHGPDSRMTFGVLHAEPASSNTVPGRVLITADIRHPQKALYDSLVTEFRRIVAEECDKRDLPLSLNSLWEAPGVEFDPACVDAVRRGALTHGYTAREMVSGAGHDSVNVSMVAPTSMIFVPCAGGLSHNEAESAKAEDIEAGCNVLLRAMYEMARA